VNGVAQILVPLALLGNGMAAGGLIISVRGAPIILRMPVAQYVPYHQYMVGRFDPFMPICMVTALLADLTLAFTVPATGTGLLCALAALLLAGTVVVSLTRNVPINLWVKTLDPDKLPEHFDKLDRRQSWVRWNAIRMDFAIAALAVNAVVLAISL
jgi:uncharacterized membrane protein